jgi:hypothetical protein
MSKHGMCRHRPQCCSEWRIIQKGFVILEHLFALNLFLLAGRQTFFFVSAIEEIKLYNKSEAV